MADQSKHESHYGRLMVMAFLSFAAMYILMYAMVDAFANVFHHVNQVYMAGLMTAPMVAIEVLLMSGMYRNRRRNALILVTSVIVGVAFFLGIRRQAVIGDAQFLRSMIPHHGGAILMCQQANIRDTRIRELCRGIVTSQRSEIELMKALLSE